MNAVYSLAPKRDLYGIAVNMVRIVQFLTNVKAVMNSNLIIIY